MALLLPIAERTVFGVPIQNAYAKIENVTYDGKTNKWSAAVSYYISKESREAEKVYKYYADVYVDKEKTLATNTIVYKEKPADLTDRQWEHICAVAIFSGSVSKIFNYEFGISNEIFKPASLDKNSLIKECYRHLQEQFEQNGITIDVDTPIEALVKMDLEKYI